MTNTFLVPRLPTIVWARPADTEPTEPGGLPAWVAERLITTYTAPGTVITATGYGAHSITQVATSLGRRASIEVPNPVRLGVLTPPAVTPDPDQLAGWARLLDAHGVLAVATADPGLGVRVLLAAAYTGLTYTQHLILTGPTDPPGDRPTNHPDRETRAALRTLDGHTDHPILGDLWVFTVGRIEHTDEATGPDLIPRFTETRWERASTADYPVRAVA